MSEWKRVESCPPSTDEWVYCIGFRGGVFIGKRDFGNIFAVKETQKVRKAEFWMPLPDPPKRGRK